MSWLLLVLAIVAEVAGTTFMKLSMGFTKLGPSILLVVFYLLSLFLLNLALKGIPVSIAYAIWSGMGTAIVVGIGWALFGEQLTTLKLISLLLIIAGVVGLNLSSSGHARVESEVQQEHSMNTTGLKEW
ncbi:DMT family transporter [Paenibacillus sp. KN14-4R]|uniref:DMT family transporter n=1 Tax=Paenibacillus sp. KN14-4R TaxID=3445773 RepID=UPI003FA0B0CD